MNDIGVLQQACHICLPLLGLLMAGCGTVDHGPEAPPHRIASASVSLSAPVWRLGGLNSALTIGEVTDAAFADSGFVMLLDGTTGTLYHIDPEGQIRAAFGRLGEGPGEFRSATAIAHTNANEMVVYDDELQRVTLLQLTPTLSVLRDVQIDGYLGELCAVDAGVVSVGFDPKTQKMVHVLDREGRVKGAFGASYLSKEGLDPEVWRAMSVSGSQSRVACRRQTNSVVYGSVLKGFVRRSTMDGHQLWETQVEGLHLSRFEARNGRTVLGFAEADTVRDVMASLNFLGDSLVLAQFGRILQSDPWPGVGYAMITSVLLDAESGAEVGRQQDLPLVVASDGHVALTVDVVEDLVLGSRPIVLSLERSD